MGIRSTRPIINTARVAIVVALAANGCASLVGLNDYTVTNESPDSGSASRSCTDEDGFNGLGCYRCTPNTVDELRNACTTADCTPFDNAERVPGFGTTLPEPTPAPVQPGTTPGGTTTTPEPPDPSLPLCSSLSRPVYLYGSTALSLGLRTLAQAVSETATLVYQSDASCAGLDSILTGITRLRGTAQYWAPGQAEPLSCVIEGEQLADIGLCDVSPESCIPNFAGSPNLVDDIGPAQVFMFTVPGGSSQKSISAEAAFKVFAYDDAGVAPWTDPESLIRRGEGSGVQLTISASLGLAPTYWRGVIKQRSSEVKPALLALDNPERGLGITSADVADEQDSRANLRTLAYQHFGQTCAFTPDSTLGSSDKQNVRDGHYELWAPLHFYTRGQNGRTQDPFIAEIVSYLTGARPLPNRNTDFITTLKQAGLVPVCAMKVTRAKEGARIEPANPSPSCSCYYDASPPGGVVPDRCATCETNADCPSEAPSCNFGYCEP